MILIKKNHYMKHQIFKMVSNYSKIKKWLIGMLTIFISKKGSYYKNLCPILPYRVREEKPLDYI